MLKLKENELENPIECPYLPDRKATNESFIAHSVTDQELDELLSKGWRKFGVYYFRPVCQGCRACLPVRISCRSFEPSRSQRRVWRRNEDLNVTVSTLSYRRELYELYLKHSKVRFDQEVSEREFQMAHFMPSCSTFLMEYFDRDRLVAFGFIDRSQNALNSVYFVYDPDEKRRSLGIYGCLQELALGKYWNKEFYYLGYWVPGNRPMNYKSQFRPTQYFHWKQEKWLDFEHEGWEDLLL